MAQNVILYSCDVERSRSSVRSVIFTSLAKVVMFLVVLVCLSVCLSVDNITQNVMNGLG